MVIFVWGKIDTSILKKKNIEYLIGEIK